MRRIIQIAPEIGPGTGVGAVAYALEQEWRRLGVHTTRFTMTEAKGGWIPRPTSGLAARLSLLARVVWFSVVGSVLARRHVRDHPEAVSVCHNDVLAGDVYVNHGIVQAAMRSRGHYVVRMLRNPVHLFTAARDAYRYRTGVHRLVVNLTTQDERLLEETYGTIRSPTVVIGNGVDTSVYTPATAHQREQARTSLGLDENDLVVLFVGHEFDRKGLPVLMRAVASAPSHVHLLVVGGTSDMIAATTRRADADGLGSRLHMVGRTSDPLPFFHASDVFAMPSAYEAYQLVVLEALACGLPVVSTPTGCVPDLVRDGVEGFVVDADEGMLRDAILAVGRRHDDLSRCARARAEERTWSRVAREYLEALPHPLESTTSAQ